MMSKVLIFEVERMDNLYIVIPAYNEEENIEKVVEEWYQVIKDYKQGQNSRLVVIDDGSKDNTYTILSIPMQ